MEVVAIGRLYSVLISQPNPIILLGAGASLKSGIPLAGGVVEKAARWAFAREHGRSPDDPGLQRSDWLPWLKQKNWYKQEHPLAENYHAAVEHLLQPRQDRANFFRELINPGVDPSTGYEKLAEFLHRGIISTVLTTNFDEALAEARRKLRRPHHLSLIQTKSDYVKFSTSPPHPQLVYLHGSVEHYTDCNILEEVQLLDDQLVTMLVPLLRDHPLIVIGYRGGEPSVMKHLLIDNVVAANYFRHGVYWCALKSEQSEDSPPFVTDLASLIGHNFQIVPIEGFDELLISELWSRYLASQPGTQSYQTPVPSTDSPTFDMKPVSGKSVADLEWATLRDRITNYCRVLDIRIPGQITREWITDQLLRQNLAVRAKDGGIAPTIAGYLLFTRTPHEHVKAARIITRVKGNPQWVEKMLRVEVTTGGSGGVPEVNAEGTTRVIEGNLWNQLDAITDVLALFNKPFRLKGEVSEMVYPYPPLALKEIIVNALAHRDYGKDEPIGIEIEPTCIRITNPGGLVDEVRRRVEPDSIENEIRRGERGIKGYRNPVIADLFYGAGAMDKAGSGLADVYKLVNDNAGNVHFGPTPDNSAFEVTIYCRPEAVDEITHTASPLIVKSTRLAANVLEVLELPEVIWNAGTAARRARDVWVLTEPGWLPPFELYDGRLFSFHDLSVPTNPLRTAIDAADVSALSLEKFTEGREGRRRLVRMLNLCLREHLESKGLLIDLRRMRAYFPRTDEGVLQITYQARLRRATRTIVTPRKSPITGKIRYWEHEALSFKFECFANVWGLLLEPGYAFTWDGKRGLLAPERVNSLSTRRASRDYNTNVHNDLIFWARLLAGDAGRGSFTLNLSPRLKAGAVTHEQEASRDQMDMNFPSNRILDVSNGVEVIEQAEKTGPRIVLASGLPIVVINDVEMGSENDEFTDDNSSLVALDEELGQLAEEERRIDTEQETEEAGRTAVTSNPPVHRQESGLSRDQRPRVKYYDD